MTGDQGDADGGRPEIGWTRAILSGIAVLVVGFLGVVYLPNVVVTKVTGLSRSARQDLATLVFLVALAVLAWALRRLQGRRLI